jgi:hypothetical protein
VTGDGQEEAPEVWSGYSYSFPSLVTRHPSRHSRRLAGGLVFLMAALLGVVTVAMVSVVRTIRSEQAMERKKAEEDAAKDTSSPPSPGPVAR